MCATGGHYIKWVWGMARQKFCVQYLHLRRITIEFCSCVTEGSEEELAGVSFFLHSHDMICYQSP